MGCLLPGGSGERYLQQKRLDRRVTRMSMCSRVTRRAVRGGATCSGTQRAPKGCRNPTWRQTTPARDGFRCLYHALLEYFAPQPSMRRLSLPQGHQNFHFVLIPLLASDGSGAEASYINRATVKRLPLAFSFHIESRFLLPHERTRPMLQDFVTATYNSLGHTRRQQQAVLGGTLAVSCESRNKAS